MLSTLAVLVVVAVVVVVMCLVILSIARNRADQEVEENNTLTIVRGLPGSGKSTLAKSLVNLGLADVVYEADDYFTDDVGNYLFVKSECPSAHEECQSSVWLALLQNKDVVVSNTFITNWAIREYLDMATQLSVDVIVIEADGGVGSIHDVPDSVVASMSERWETFHPASETLDAMRESGSSLWFSHTDGDTYCITGPNGG